MQYIKFSLLFIVIIFISACATQDSPIFSSDSTNKKEFNQRTGEVSKINNPNEDLDFSKSKLETIYFADRKSTRLNSSHVAISYAVFCLKKKIFLRRNQSIIIMI